MKTFKQLMEGLMEAWPGTPGYKKTWGDGDGSKSGARHNIEKKGGITRATRKYDDESGESEEPKVAADGGEPVKRGRGRPPGKYGSYKKKVKESLEIMESLETEEEIAEFISSLDEESFVELEAYLAEGEEQLDELSKTTLGSYAKKASTNARMNSIVAKDFEAAGNRAKSPGNKAAAKSLSQKYKSKAWKRQAGVDKAIDRLTKEEVEQTEENIKHPNQKVLDKNKNGKLDKEDFKILRGEKKMEEQAESLVDSIAALITKQSKGEA